MINAARRFNLRSASEERRAFYKAGGDQRARVLERNDREPAAAAAGALIRLHFLLGRMLRSWRRDARAANSICMRLTRGMGPRAPHKSNEILDSRLDIHGRPFFCRGNSARERDEVVVTLFLVRTRSKRGNEGARARCLHNTKHSSERSGDDLNDEKSGHGAHLIGDHRQTCARGLLLQGRRDLKTCLPSLAQRSL